MNKKRFKASLVIYEPRDGSQSYEVPLRCRFGFHKRYGTDQCVLCGDHLKGDTEDG